MKFERSRRYRDRYRCQSRRGRARDLVFRDPPTPGIGENPLVEVIVNSKEENSFVPITSKNLASVHNNLSINFVNTKVTL